MSYTNWTPGRSSNFYSHSVEDCVVFVPYLDHGHWDDIPCGRTSTSSSSSASGIEGLYETHYYMCQYGKI